MRKCQTFLNLSWLKQRVSPILGLRLPDLSGDSCTPHNDDRLIFLGIHNALNLQIIRLTDSGSAMTINGASGVYFALRVGRIRTSCCLTATTRVFEPVQPKEDQPSTLIVRHKQSSNVPWHNNNPSLMHPPPNKQKVRRSLRRGSSLENLLYHFLFIVG